MNNLKINFLTNLILLVLYCTLTKAADIEPLSETLTSEIVTPEVQSCYDMMEKHFGSIDASLENCVKHAIRNLALSENIIPIADKYVRMYMQSFRDERLASISGSLIDKYQFCHQRTLGRPWSYPDCLSEMNIFNSNKKNTLLIQAIFYHIQQTDEYFDDVCVHSPGSHTHAYLEEIARTISIVGSSSNDNKYSTPRNYCKWIVKEDIDYSDNYHIHNLNFYVGDPIGIDDRDDDDGNLLLHIYKHCQIL